MFSYNLNITPVCCWFCGDPILKCHFRIYESFGFRNISKVVRSMFFMGFFFPLLSFLCFSSCCVAYMNIHLHLIKSLMVWFPSVSRQTSRCSHKNPLVCMSPPSLGTKCPITMKMEITPIFRQVKCCMAYLLGY